MRPNPSALLLSATLLAACAPARSTPLDVRPRDTPGIGAVVDSIVTSPNLRRAQWGIHVTDANGRVVYALNPDQLFSAASNAKLATIAAALDLLGPGHRWTTTLETRGVENGVAGALLVRGTGDPTLSAHFHDHPLAPLDSLADSLAMAGIRRIAGPLVVDQSRFDSVLVHPAWENFDLDWYYAAPVAPFAVLEGAYPVVITPGALGSPARVDLPFDAFFAADARVETVEGERGWNDDLRRVAGTDSVVLRGRIGVAAGADTSWIAQDEPGRVAGRALARALERRGITVEGPVVVTRDPAAQALPATAGPRASWRSPPLEEVARVSLEQSDNWVTEQVLKTLGAEHGEGGSWSAGTAVVERYLAENVGIDPAAIYLRDGSGLTPQTLLTPAAITALLRHVATRPWSGTYRAALASPGEVESTLEDRLAGHEDRVAAKTGSIRHVNALSGYARTRDGEVLVFSVLSNASGRPSSEVRRALDRIVEAIIDNGS